MNAKMLQDALDAEKRKTKILSIILAITICAFVGMTIFAFCSFEVVSEDTTEISYEGNIGDGENGTIEQINSTTAQDNSVYMICGTVIACVGLIVLGVYLYGKSKNVGKNDNQKNKESRNPQTQCVCEEKEVEHGTPDKN